VIAPKEIILNSLMTLAHINGSKPTSMSFKINGVASAEEIIMNPRGTFGTYFAWGLGISSNNRT
jgi:hypothetical protein